MENIELIKQIRKTGKSAKGKSELLKHLEGKTLTRGQAIKAMCYDCSGWFLDGKTDCQLPTCPLYPFMGYKD